MEVRFNIKLTEGQQKAYEMVHDPENKIIVMNYSRQQGKSTIAQILAIEYLFQQNTFNGYIMPTYDHCRKVFRQIMPLLNQTDIVTKANETTLTIETKYGSTLRFFSGEAAMNIRGNTFSGILIIDEASYFPDILPNGEYIWANVILPTTKVRDPKIVIISTPRGKQGFFYDFYLRALSGEKGIVQITRTIYDDSLATPELREYYKKSMPPKAFQQEFECVFLDSSLTFFEGFEKCFKPYKYKAERQWLGVDLSANGTDDTIITRINEKNETEVIKVSGTLDEKYRKIADIIDKSNPVSVYIENNGIGAPMINEIKKLTRFKNRIYEWSTTNASKEEILSDMAVKIANMTVSFNEEDTELFSQLGTFICKISKSKRLTFAAQDGKKDDMVMATAIAIRCKEDFKNSGFNNNVFINTNRGWIR